MNCLAIEQADGIVIVDCGAGFPEDDLGVDVLHPDFSWLLERKERVRGVFLTHGHEDHIGGLPYLLADLEVPVWGPPHALELAKRRLSEHDFAPGDLDFREAQPGGEYEVGPFRIEPVRVAHSIVEASALAIQTVAGTIVHSGDFNFDPDPPDGEPTDEARLSAIGDRGVALLLSDSTNIDVPERAGSERSVHAALEPLVLAAEERCVVALFASNIQRLISLGEVAQKAGRKLCLLGRSLDTQAEVGKRIGRLHWPSDLLVSPEEARELPRDRLLILAGGTQAEKNSALRRLSLATHPLITLEPGDTVIFSSRVIPGNERPFNTMLNDLLRRGVIVKSRVTEPGVHTSGHAGRSEQRRMMSLVRPRCFLPVHGTLHHLLRHAELAEQVGIGERLVVENGTPVICDGQRLSRDDQVQHGKIAIAFGGEPLDRATLQSRSDISRFGLVVATVVLDQYSALVAPPRVTSRGVPAVDDRSSSLRALSLEIERGLTTYREGRGLSLEEFLKRTLRRKLQDLSGTRPIIELDLVRTEV